MSTRPVLDPSQMSPAAAEKAASFQADSVRRVRESVERDAVVVVGMSQNPHVKNVRRMLDGAGIEFTYLEFGSYFSGWQARLGIKLWSGWPTFPQVFVKGTLIGGEDLTKAALEDGTLKGKLDGAKAEPAAA